MSPVCCTGYIFLSFVVCGGTAVAMFNVENSTCHMIAEDCGLSNALKNFAGLACVQIVTGRDRRQKR